MPLPPGAKAKDAEATRPGRVEGLAGRSRAAWLGIVKNEHLVGTISKLVDEKKTPKLLADAKRLSKEGRFRKGLPPGFRLNRNAPNSKMWSS